jgi:hypothetical protein
VIWVAWIGKRTVCHFNESKEIIASNKGCKENSHSTKSDGCVARPVLLSCQVKCMYDSAEVERLHNENRALEPQWWRIAGNNLPYTPDLHGEHQHVRHGRACQHP